MNNHNQRQQFFFSSRIKTIPTKMPFLAKPSLFISKTVLPHVTTRCLPKSTERPALGSRTSLRTTKRGLKSELTELTISGLEVVDKLRLSEADFSFQSVHLQTSDEL